MSASQAERRGFESHRPLQSLLAQTPSRHRAGTQSDELHLADQQALEPHPIRVAAGDFIEKIDQAAVPPLQHALVRHEPVTHTDAQLDARARHQSLVRLRRVIPEVLAAVLARLQRTRDAPDDNAGVRVNLHRHAAMRDRTTAGHAERTADQDVADAHRQVAGQLRVVQLDGLARAGLVGKEVENEIERAPERVGPLRPRRVGCAAGAAGARGRRRESGRARSAGGGRCGRRRRVGVQMNAAFEQFRPLAEQGGERGAGAHAAGAAIEIGQTDGGRSDG